MFSVTVIASIKFPLDDALRWRLSR